MNKVSIVHYIGATARTYSVVASIVSDLRDEGREVSVVDLEPTTTVRQGYPPNFLARVLGHSVRRNAFADALRDRGASLQTLPLAAGERPIPQEHQESLAVAIESELLTYFRMDHIPFTQEAKRLREALEVNAARTFWSLRALWSESKPDEVLVPNGRTSRQRVARLLAEQMQIPLRLYENGRALRQAYYLGSTQPHDRIASQAEVESLTASVDPNSITKLAKEWLESRLAGSLGTNIFSIAWNPIRPSHAGSDERKTAVFFASSFDEFLAFGPMWSIDGWSSQFEAFDLIMSVLEKRGINLVLRLHPNLGAKSRKYFMREVNEIFELQRKHPSLVVHWHNSPTNSYQLVMEADYVIVERSTIGLEASLMGKPVWATQATQWDQVADIRQILRPADVTAEILSPWSPSPRGAERFVAYWMLQEHPLRYEATDWASWDPDNAPTSMKLLQLALPNSWRHKIRLISLEWSKWRNKRFIAPGSFPQGQ